MTKRVLVAALLLAPTLVLAQAEIPAPAPTVTPTAPTPVVPQFDTTSPSLTAPAADETTTLGDSVAPVGETVVPETETTPATQTPVDESAKSPAPALDETSISSETGVPTPEDTSSQDESSPLTDNGNAPDVETTQPDVVAQPEDEDLVDMAQDASQAAMKFLQDGGPSIWAIAALSVITLTLILWKIWRLALIGAWSRGKAGQAVQAFENSDGDLALSTVAGRRGIRSKVVATALTAIADLPEDRAREETARVAKREIASARVGLGALELISTIAPLLGLLGTVLGMIAAFQALQAAGSKADPALLAGGIWEALLTTAAGMAVAIPASAALTWFESVIERIRRDIEDSATRLFVAQKPEKLRLAAE